MSVSFPMIQFTPSGSTSFSVPDSQEEKKYFTGETAASTQLDFNFYNDVTDCLAGASVKSAKYRIVKQHIESYITDVNKLIRITYDFHIRGTRKESDSITEAQQTTGLPQCIGNKATYNGSLRDGKFHDYGVLIINEESEYKGMFQKGKRHGLGVQTYEDGRKFIGEFHENKACGFGVLTFKNGTKHEGFWQENKLHGYGIKKYPDGTCYGGMWAGGIQEGLGFQGKRQHDSLGRTTDTIYYGNLCNGQPSGFGVMFFLASDVVYSFERNNYENFRDVFHFEHDGVMSIPPSKTVYAGDWKKGKHHGYGFYFGRKVPYVGEWADGMMHGAKLEWFLEVLAISLGYLISGE